VRRLRYQVATSLAFVMIKDDSSASHSWGGLTSAQKLLGCPVVVTLFGPFPFQLRR
jgi:hypothetical protein